MEKRPPRSGRLPARRAAPRRRAAATRAPEPPAPARKVAFAQVGARLAAIDPGLAARAGRGEPRELGALLSDLGAQDAARRTQAARSLGDSGFSAALEPLREKLDDPDRSVRGAAALALLRLGDRRLFHEALKDLADASARRVTSAAHALGLSGNPAAVEPLLAAFRTHEVGVGAAIAGALGRLGDARAARPLLAALHAGFVPAHACAALGRLADPAAIPALAKALRHADKAVRTQAARALAMFKGRAAESPVRARLDKALPLLRARLDDAHPPARLAAALALFELGDRAARERVLHELSRAGERAGGLTAKKRGG